MTKVELEEDQIFLGLTKTGEWLTARGQADTTHYNLESAFIVPDATPLFEISNFQAYRKLPATWIEVDLR